MALSAHFYSQNSNPWPTSGNVGIGTNSPAYPLDVQTSAGSGNGIRIKNNGASGGEATLRLNAVTPGGGEYAIHSIGNGWGSSGPAGSFMIRDESASGGPKSRFLIQGSTGNVGIGTVSPGYKLHIETAASNDGVYVKQTYGEAAALHLDNGSTGGRHWALFSTGTSNYQGTGNFSIYDYNSNMDRLFIQGSSGNVGVGTSNPTLGKFQVEQDGEPLYNRAIYATSLKTTGTAAWCIGVEGRGGFLNECGPYAYGVVGWAFNGNVSMGGYFDASTTICDARRSTKGGNSLSVGVYGTGNTYGAYFSGDLEHTGTLTEPSDRKLNDNVKPLQNVMAKINLLKPYTYTYKTEEFKDMKLPEGQQMGLIAQDLDDVFPELVKNAREITNKNKDGEIISSIPEHKSVNYLSLIPVLVAGIQEQQQIIVSQQKQLDEQKQMIDALVQKSETATGIQNNNTVEVGFQMSQNEPNPFTHETVVKYTMPQSVSNAFMAVYDLTGKQITTFLIDQRGSSSITLTSEKLAAGIYIYSIVADGKIVDSKRMVVSEK